MKVNFLQAFNGDAIHISYQDPDGIQRNILIDGGIGKTYAEKTKKKTKYNELFDLVNSVREKGEKIDLLIMTHVDDDHIGGILKWFQHDADALGLIDKIWFNSGRLIKSEYGSAEQEDEEDTALDFEYDDSLETGIKQGVKFEDFLDLTPGKWHKQLICSGMVFTEWGLDFRIISPDENKLKLLLRKWEKEAPDSLETSAEETDFHIPLKDLIAEADSWTEDKAVQNGSSIALSLTYNSKQFLFLGDAHPSVFTYWLQSFNATKEIPIKFELVKMSHHGSQFNNSKEFLDLIDANYYVISTNSQTHGHPHKRLLARLIKQKINPVLHFNYPELIDDIFLPEDFAEFPFLKSLDRSNAVLNF